MDTCLIDLLKDEAAWIYGANLLMAIAGTAIFTWWWVRAGRVSTIYAFITIFIVGHLVTNATNLFARMVSLSCGPTGAHEVYLHAWWWPKRYYLETIALALLVGTAIKRAFSKTRQLPP